MNSAGISLKKPSSKLTKLDLSLCIICQENGIDNIVSNSFGRQKVMYAAEIRKVKSGIVYGRCRIQINKCYKTYTHKTKLNKIQSSPSETDKHEENQDNNRDSIFRSPSPKRTR